jgi:hypothetical protein
MKNEEITLIIERLTAGDFTEINASKHIVQKICRELGNNCKVHFLDKKVCLVIKPQKVHESLQYQIIEICKKLNFLDEISIQANYGHVRNVVSKFNSDNGRNVKVRTKAGEVIIYEDFLTRKIITSGEFHALKEQLLFIEQKMQDRIGSGSKASKDEILELEDKPEITEEDFNDDLEDQDHIGEMDSEDHDEEDLDEDDEDLI